MRTRAQRRGEPLIVMSAIVLTWIAGRMAIWQAPDALPVTAEQAPLSIPGAPELVRVNHFALKGAFGFAPADNGQLTIAGFASGAPSALVTQPVLAPLALVGAGWTMRQIAPQSDSAHQALHQTVDGHRNRAPSQDGDNPAGPVPKPSLAAPPIGSTPLPPAPVRSRPPERVTASHNLLWMAAVSNIPFSQIMTKVSAQPNLPSPQFGGAPLSPAAARSDVRRWSADGWLLLRRGGGIGSPGAAFPSYGASQAGAVLRYRLAPASGHRPSAYLRGSAALNGSSEREVAAGLSARPVAVIPVSVSAELRATRFASGTKVRPAAFAVTELPPARLPAGMRAEAYAQAGYVGGTYATAFVDGQLKLDRRLVSLGGDRAEARIGAGVWGGAQKGASRLDVGPSATLGFKVGEGSGRLSADWRFRIAGNATPRSGPALTLSAGF